MLVYLRGKPMQTLLRRQSIDPILPETGASNNLCVCFWWGRQNNRSVVRKWWQSAKIWAKRRRAKSSRTHLYKVGRTMCGGYENDTCQNAI